MTCLMFQYVVLLSDAELSRRYVGSTSERDKGQVPRVAVVRTGPVVISAVP